jgi:hypothetical protein
LALPSVVPVLRLLELALRLLELVWPLLGLASQLPAHQLALAKPQ